MGKMLFLLLSQEAPHLSNSKSYLTDTKFTYCIEKKTNTYVCLLQVCV